MDEGAVISDDMLSSSTLTWIHSPGLSWITRRSFGVECLAMLCMNHLVTLQSLLS